MEPVLGGEIFIAKQRGQKWRQPAASRKDEAVGTGKRKTDGLTEGINVRLIVHCSVVVSPSPPG